MRTLKYYFKSTRRDEAPRRWAYNPQATQLGHWLLRLNCLDQLLHSR